MKFYTVFLLFFTGCNLFSESEETPPTHSNNSAQTNNGTQPNNGIQTNNGFQTNNITLTNQNTTNQNTTQTTTATEYEIPFESLIGESRSTKGLVSQWKFEDVGTSLILDTSGSEPPMNLTGTATGLTRIEGRNGIVIASGGKLVANDSSILFSELTFTEKFTVELWLKTADFAQTGPTRMVTFSEDSSSRNFTLGQQNDKVVARLRADVGSTSGPGRVNGLGQLVSLGNLNLGLQHVVWTYDGNFNEIWIDGVRDVSQTVPGGLSNWDPAFQFAFGDETTGNRQWRGELYYAAIYNRPLTDQEIIHHEKLGSQPNPVLAQDRTSVIVQDCETWPFDILKPESFDLLEQTSCSTAAGSIYVDGASRTKLSTLSNLVAIEGDLIVNGIQEDNLDALASLKSIGGNLILSNNENLTNFVGLSNLEFVGGDLIIENNRRAQNTSGFAKLRTLPGNLSISNNVRISSVSGFSNLGTIEGALSIDRNSSLKILKLDSLITAKRISISHGGVETISLPALGTIDEFWVRSTDFLTEISGLSANKYYFLDNRTLTSISQLSTTRDTNLTITDNPDLEILNGITGTEINTLNIRSSPLTNIEMDNLQHVHGDLRLYNTALVSLGGEFSSLINIDGRLKIEYNYSLQTLNNAFPTLENVDTLELYRNYDLIKISDGFPSLLVVNDFEVTYNTILPQCDVVLSMANFTLLGTFLAHDNDNLAICP